MAAQGETPARLPGWLYHPLVPGKKTPLTKSWQSIETLEQEELAFSRVPPNAGYGLLTGSVIVLDFDKPKPGELDAWQQYEKLVGAATCSGFENSEPVRTVKVRTASGGVHLYFAATKHYTNSTRVRFEGTPMSLDIRGHGGYVVAPPTRRVETKSGVGDYTYEVSPEEVGKLPEMPGWLQEFAGLEPKKLLCDFSPKNLEATDRLSIGQPEVSEAATKNIPPYLGGEIVVSAIELKITLALVEEILAKVEVSREQWGGALANLKSLIRTPALMAEHTEPMYSIVDAWSRRIPGYDAEENKRQWYANSGSGPGNPSFEVLVGMAVKQGWQPADVIIKNMPDLVSYTTFHLMKEARHFTTRERAVAVMRACLARICGTQQLWIMKVREMDADAKSHMVFKPAKDLGTFEGIIARDPDGGAFVPLKRLVQKYQEEFMYGNVIFYPMRELRPIEETFNTFPGFLATSKENVEIATAFEWHVTNILANRDPAAAECILNTLALLVQRPEVKPSIAYVFQGVEGCGKNAILDFVGNRVIGPSMYLCTTSLEMVLGRFNGALENRKMVVLNEAEINKNWSTGNDKLKGLVTENRLPIENKSMEVRVANFFAGIFICSNHVRAVKVEVGDRRKCCIRCSPEKVGDREYFARLFSLLYSEEGPGAVMHYLLSRDITGWDHRVPPMTEYKAELMDADMTATQKFVKQVVLDKLKQDVSHYEPTTEEFWEEYKLYETKKPRDDTKAKFGASLKMLQIEKRRPCRGEDRVYVYTLDIQVLKSKLGIQPHELHEPPE
jgi:hypothetical protein